MSTSTFEYEYIWTHLWSPYIEMEYAKDVHYQVMNTEPSI